VLSYQKDISTLLFLKISKTYQNGKITYQIVYSKDVFLYKFIFDRYLFSNFYVTFNSITNSLIIVLHADGSNKILFTNYSII